MKINRPQGLVGPYGIILLSLIIIYLWFGKGLLFGGGEEALAYYNYTKSLNLFSHIWYASGSGFPVLTNIPRLPYYIITQPFYEIGIPNIYLESLTFLILILIGTLSVYFLLKITLSDKLTKNWGKAVPFLGALFYFFNPYSMTQIWGRAISYQFFSFALVPSFLLFFILAIQRRNVIFSIFAALISFFLSVAYGSPAIVLTSWAAVSVYLIFYIYTNRKNAINFIYAIFNFVFLFIIWGLVNFYWIYPTLKYGEEIFSHNLTVHNNIEIMKALSHNNSLLNVLRLIHIGFNENFGQFYNSTFYALLSWFLPIFALFSISHLRKTGFFLFFGLFFVLSLIVSIGANFPTGGFLIYLFKIFPLLQVLRNSYEKFGINLTLAYTPFFAIGLLNFSEKFALLFKTAKLKYIFIPTFIIITCVVLVWPLWKGNFAGGIKTNSWVKVPIFYKQVNDWLNSQTGDFNILHVPLLPGDGISYTWNHPYEGIEPSEFLFDKESIARLGYNENYYFALLDRFGAEFDYRKLPNWTRNSEDFKEALLKEELAKLNLRYIILHFDINHNFRQTKSSDETRKYLESQEGIKSIARFGDLEIFQVNIPNNIGLIYSPNTSSNYRKIDTSTYVVNIKDAKGLINLYFLQKFHPGWTAYVDNKKVSLHKEIFSYANGWQIDKNGDFRVDIKYEPQDSVIVGWKVTGFVLILIAILISILLLKRLRIIKLFA